MNSGSLNELVGRNISAARLEQGISLPRLAALVSTSVHKLEQWEAGTLRVPVSMLLAIAQELRKLLAYFFK